MHTTQNTLNRWLEKQINHRSFTLTPIAGDASFRHYSRLKTNNQSYIVMDSSSEKASLNSFVSIANALAQLGVHAPNVHAADYQQGFALLEDLGDHLFLREVSTKNADHLYTAALSTLLKLHVNPISTLKLPTFDRTFIWNELTLFRDWTVQGYLGITLNASEQALLDSTFDWLAKALLRQPTIFVHRDYHSRNLLVNYVNDTDTIDIGVIDFQDAILGPFCYDLVSLLKDCYIQWPRDTVLAWLDYFYTDLPSTYGYSFSEFCRAFGLCGLQRHIKVLGIFCRLHFRDQKSAYLNDLPLTMHYVMQVLESTPELQSFYTWMQQRIAPTLLEKLNS